MPITFPTCKQYGEILPHSLHKTIDLPYKILWHTLCIIPNEAGGLIPAPLFEIFTT